ncbi:MAG: hypothetical protein MPN21_20955 [Thermoanaerobaculia bacterium]|nr:hypothetical protein [Thermoanaerobaculia bacterium]
MADLVGVGALATPSLTVAQRYLDADPAVQAGTLGYELRSWNVTMRAVDDPLSRALE